MHALNPTQAHFVSAYIAARGDLAAIAEHMGVTPLEALDLAIHPAVAPRLEQFLTLERARHGLHALTCQADAAETLRQLLTLPAERAKSVAILARLSTAMALAARPPRPPRPLPTPKTASHPASPSTQPPAPQRSAPRLAAETNHALAQDDAPPTSPLASITPGTAHNTSSTHADLTHAHPAIEPKPHRTSPSRPKAAT